MARGRLHQIHRGVYAVGRPELTREGHWMAAVLAGGPGALLSHRSAAALHRLISNGRSRIDVSRPGPSSLTRPGMHVHRRSDLRDADRTVVNGIPCTSVARTLLDLAGVLDRGRLERACDQAEVERVFDLLAIEELLGRSRGRRGVRALREVLGAGGVGEDLTRSKLERRFFALCRRAGVAKPAVNAWIVLGGEHHEVDFVWRRERVVVETDGYAYHRSRGAFRRDRRRDQLLDLDGWRHTRFTWDDVLHDPQHVLRVLRTLFGPSPS